MTAQLHLTREGAAQLFAGVVPDQGLHGVTLVGTRGGTAQELPPSVVPLWAVPTDLQEKP